MSAATPPVLTIVVPWELPGISLVIGDDEPFVPTPILYPVPVADEEEHVLITYGVHKMKSLTSILPLKKQGSPPPDGIELLEKWYLIFARGRSGWPRGYEIDTLVAQKGLGGLRSIFGNRSRNTVLKRTSSIIRFIHWFANNSFSIFPFPLQSFDVEGYLEFCKISPHIPQLCRASLRLSIFVRRS